MHYEKIGAVVRRATPEDLKPLLTPKQVEKLKTIGEVTLATIAAAGILTVGAVAPNVLGAIGKLMNQRYPRRKFTKREKDRKITQAFYYLKRHGCIRMRPTGSDVKIFLTKLGRKRLRKLNFEVLVIERPKSWDGRWWQVAADIPTKKYKRGADLLRQKLRDMGFFPLQRTLWFYPFDPRREVELVVERYGIERFVTAMEISRLDRDDEKRMMLYFRKERVLK